MPSAGRADAGRSGSVGRDVLLREGRPEGHRRRRLGRRLEALPLRLGVQGEAREPRRGLRSAPAVFAGAREPAAADRVRHGAVPDPHQLDEQRQPDIRVRARRSGRRVDARPAEVGVLGSRSAAARERPGSRSPSAWRLRSRRWPRHCASAGTIRRRLRTSSTGSSSACSPTTSVCFRTTCSRGCCAMRGLLRSGSPNWPATCSR